MPGVDAADTDNKATSSSVVAGSGGDARKKARREYKAADFKKTSTDDSDADGGGGDDDEDDDYSAEIGDDGEFEAKPTRKRTRGRKFRNGNRIGHADQASASANNSNDDDGGGDDEAEEAAPGDEEAAAPADGKEDGALFFRTDDKIDERMNELMSAYCADESSFVVSAIPVHVFGPDEAVFVVCVAIVLINDAKVQTNNGQLYADSERHACRPLRLQELLAAEKFDQANALRERLSALRESSKAGYVFGLRSVRFEQMFVVIRNIPPHNSPALPSLRISDFFSPLLQYQLRVRLVVDQLGSRQFPRFCVFPGSKVLTRKAMRAYAAVALTNHEYARFCLGTTNPRQRLCTSALPVPLNCVAVFEFIDMAGRPRADFGLPEHLPLTSSEQLEAEKHAQNVEADFRASIENNPFMALENVTLGDVEASSSSSDDEAAGAPPRVNFNANNAKDDDDDYSGEDLGDYDRNDSVAPIFDLQPPKSEDAIDDNDDEAEAAAAAEAAAEREREARLAREAEAQMRRRWAKKLDVASKMLDEERRERAKSLVGEASRDGATKFTQDFRRCSPESDATSIWRPMRLASRGVRSLIPARSAICRPLSMLGKPTVGGFGGAGYDTVGEWALLPLVRTTFINGAMLAVPYNHEVALPHALKHFNEHGLRSAGAAGYHEPLDAEAVCTRECLCAAANNEAAPIERQIIASLPINKKFLSTWMRKLVVMRDDKNAPRALRLRDFLGRHFRFEEAPLSAAAEAKRWAGFETMEVSRAARFRCFTRDTLMAIDVCGAGLFPEAFWIVMRVVGRECALLALAQGVLEHLWRLLNGASPHAVLFRRTLLALVLPVDMTMHLPRVPAHQRAQQLAHLQRSSTALEECVGGAMRLSDTRPHVRRNFLVHRAARALGRRELVRNVLLHALPRLLWRDPADPAATAGYFAADDVAATELRIDTRTRNARNFWASFRHANHLVALALEIFIGLCDADDVRSDRCVIVRLANDDVVGGSVVGQVRAEDLALFYPRAPQCDLAATLLTDGRVVFELAENYRYNAILRRLLVSATPSNAFRRFGVDVVRVDTIEALDCAFVRALHTHVVVAAAASGQQQQRRRFAIVVALDRLECERYKAIVRTMDLDATVRVFLASNDILKTSEEYRHWLAAEVRYEWNAVPQQTEAADKVLLFVPRADRFSRALFANVLNVLTSNLLVSLRRLQVGDASLTQREKDVFEAHNAGGVADDARDAEFTRRKLDECVARALVGQYAFLGGLALVQGSHFRVRDELGEPSLVEDLFFAAPRSLHRTIDWRADMFIRRDAAVAAAQADVTLRVWSHWALRARFERAAAESAGFSILRLRTSFPQNAPFVKSLHLTSARAMDDELEQRVVRNELPLTFMAHTSVANDLYEMSVARAREHENGGQGLLKNLWLLPASDDAPLTDGAVRDVTSLMAFRTEPRALTRLGVSHRLKNDVVEDERLRYLSTNCNVRFVVCDSVADNHFLAAHPQPPSAPALTDYEALAAAQVTGNDARERYISWRQTMRAARDAATAGFGVGQWVALASAPPASVIVLGSYEQSVRARFAARFVPPRLYHTAYDEGNTNDVGVFWCYFNGPTSALAYTLLAPAAQPAQPQQHNEE
jgi:hypothetical protein